MDRIKLLIVILGVLMFSVTSLAEENTIFSLDLTVYNNDSVSLNSFGMTEGSPTNFGRGEYLIKILDRENEVLYQENFSVGFSIEYDVINGSSPPPERLDSRGLYLRLPYFYNARKINIYKKNKKIFDFDIPSKLCSDDGACNSFCDGKDIDPDCKSTEARIKDNESLSKIIFEFIRNVVNFSIKSIPI